MPRIDKLFTLEVSVKQFLRHCSATELQELDLLLGKRLNRIGAAADMERLKVTGQQTKWVGIHLPLEMDKTIRRLQEKYEDAGLSKPSKADLIVELLSEGIECANFEELVKQQLELFNERETA